MSASGKMSVSGMVSVHLVLASGSDDRHRILASCNDDRHRILASGSDDRHRIRVSGSDGPVGFGHQVVMTVAGLAEDFRPDLRSGWEMFSLTFISDSLTCCEVLPVGRNDTEWFAWI